MIDNKKLEHSVEKIKLARGKGDMKLAERLCLQALQDDPVNLTILFQLSDIYFAGGNYTETVQVLKKIIGTGVKNPEIQTALGLALHKSGDIDAALREYSLAVEMDPANRARLDQVWKAAWEGGQFQLGADFLLKKLQLKQDEPFDWYNLSIIYTQIHDLPKARKAIEYAIEYKNDDPRFYSLLLTICQAEKSHEEALVICRRLLELEPQELRHYVNSGYFLARMKKTTEALELFKMAREIDPDNELVIRNCYHAMLKLGDYTNGFALFEKRLQSKELAPLFEKFADIPRWEGEVLGDKKLLVHCEQGFGDAIQFVRFLPMVTSRATNIVFLVPGALYKIFTSSFPEIDIRPEEDAEFAAEEFFRVVSVMSLANIMGAEKYNFLLTPYLQAAADKTAMFADKLPKDKFLIGIFWNTGTRYQDELLNNRSCELKQFQAFASVLDVTYINLQKEPCSDTETGLLENMISFNNEIDDFSDTAALIEGLDLIVSIDSSVAHLAGALGKDVWLLLPFDQSWRWLDGKTDTPWYRSMRIFQQTREGDWNSVFAYMTDELQKHTQKWREEYAG